MKKILSITGSRAEYGLAKSTFQAICDHKNLELSLIVTGQHFSEQHGNTFEIVKADFSEQAYYLEYDLHSINQSGLGLAWDISQYMFEFPGIMGQVKPDCVLVWCDLAHSLAGALSAVCLGIPIAHVHGGDVSGNVDDSFRHAITKLAHIHFTASEASTRRVIQMGENPHDPKNFTDAKVFNVGAPGLDDIFTTEFTPWDEIARKYDLPLVENFIILILHPETINADTETLVNHTITAILKLKTPTIALYPNNDPGHHIIIDAYQRNFEHMPFVKVFKHLPRHDFLSLMHHASAMVGNSSCALIEAPYLYLGAANIGKRQDDRERANNVFQMPVRATEIETGIRVAMHHTAMARKSKMPFDYTFGRGHAGRTIASILASTDFKDSGLLEKKFWERG